MTNAFNIYIIWFANMNKL